MEPGSGIRMSGHASDHDTIWESLPEYALGVLDPDENAAVEAHLAGCADCRAELQSLRAITAGLALTLDPVPEPVGHQARFAQKLEQLDPVATPPGHRDRFLQKLEAETVPPVSAPQRDGVGDIEATRPAPIPLTLPQRPPSAIRTWGGWAAAGALAAGLVLAILWGNSEQEQATRQAAAAQATALVAQTRIAAAEATAGAGSQVAAILASPAGKATTLAGSGSLQAARARLWMDPNSGMMVLRADELPPAPQGRQYELWLLRGSTPVAVDLMPAAGATGGTYLFALPPGAPGEYTAAALTVEVRRETAPTSAPVLVGNF